MLSRLWRRGGFGEEAENLLKLVRLRISGDYLQTSAVIRNGKIVSAVNDPNDYQGPGTGYRLSEARREEIVAIRDVLTRQEVLRVEAAFRPAEVTAHRLSSRRAGDGDAQSARGRDRH